MARVRQNRYTLSFGSSVGIIMDEKLMKELAKINYQSMEKILTLLENNEEHYWNYDWNIAKEPKGVAQHERTYYHIDYSDRFLTLEERIKEMFNITKVKHVYDVGNLGWPEKMEVSELEHTKHLKTICLDQ